MVFLLIFFFEKSFACSDVTKAFTVHLFGFENQFPTSLNHNFPFVASKCYRPILWFKAIWDCVTLAEHERIIQLNTDFYCDRREGREGEGEQTHNELHSQ